MSMIARYKRPGGFLQLVRLVETTHDKKKAQFLKIIEKEDPRWALAVRDKIITAEKLLSWPPEALREIFLSVQEITLGVVLHGLNNQQKDYVLEKFTPHERRKARDAMECNAPSQYQIDVGMFKMIEQARNLIQSGRRRYEHFNSSLQIPNEFEKLLDEGSIEEASAHLREHQDDSWEEAEGESSEPQKPAGEPQSPLFKGGDADVIDFDQHKMHMLRRDITHLKAENTQLKGRIRELEQLLRLSKSA